MAKTYKTEVEILGNTYTIRGDDDPAYIKQVAEYVDRQMREVIAKTSTISTDKVAILIALNIADELFKTRQLVTERVRSLIKQIDEGLTGVAH